MSIIEMRSATEEERMSTLGYIESISKPTGINFWNCQNMEITCIEPTTLTVAGEEVPKRIIDDRSFSGTFTATNKDFIEKILKPTNYSPTAEMVLYQVQKRKHKKRRINKKWAKRYGYYDVVLTGVLQDADIGWSDEANPQRQFVLENIKIEKRESK